MLELGEHARSLGLSNHFGFLSKVGLRLRRACGGARSKMEKLLAPYLFVNQGDNFVGQLDEQITDTTLSLAEKITLCGRQFRWRWRQFLAYPGPFTFLSKGQPLWLSAALGLPPSAALLALSAHSVALPFFLWFR
jgi:hypothetical protein